MAEAGIGICVSSRRAVRGAWRLGLLLITLMALRPASGADAISIDFIGGGGNGTPAAMAGGESAGVLPRTNWTSLAGANGSASGLVDDAGIVTTAAVTWSSNNAWSTTIADVAGNARMMKGYLDNTNTSTTTVSVSGLPSWLTRYDVYVYIDSALGNDSSVGRYVIASAPNSAIDNNTSGEQNSGYFAGTFIPGNGTRGNHVVFRGVSGSAFTLNATPIGGSVPRAPVNGLQIVQPTFTHRPLALTGWTHDVVWENSGTPAAVNSDQTNPAANASTWFAEGVGGHDDGLPAVRWFTSVSDPTTQYHLAPYTTANALRLNSGSAGTLTLVRPTTYGSLRVLASSGSGGGSGDVVITFTDTTTSAPIAYTGTDWGGNAPVDGALTRLARNASSSGFVYDRPVDFNLYETRIDLVALGYDMKPIQSLSFTRAGTAQVTNVFAVSGQSTGVRVDTVSPLVGVAAGGTTLTISGANFVSGATVSIEGVDQGAATFVNANQLTITTPAHGAGAVAVTVTNPDGTGYVLDDGFTYLGPPPSISGLSPASGSPFTTTDVVISGADFVAPVSVTVGGIAATNVSFTSSSSISARFPAMTGTDATPDVVVVCGDGQSVTAANAFTWTMRQPDDVSSPQAGLAWRLHHAAGPLLPDFSTLIPVATGTRANATFEGFNPLEPGRGDNWSAEFSGYLTVPADGIYTLFTASDDGSRLYIGTTLVVTNNFSQGITERSGQIALAAGRHRMRVEYAQGTGGYGLYLRWQGPTVAKADIPDAAFSHDPAPAITAVSPLSGGQSGGTSVTITGSGFVSGSLVAIGGVRVSDAVVLSSTSIALTTPGGPLGAQDVLVIGPRSIGATATGAFTYTISPAPTVTAISPTSGAGIGGTTVTLTVSNVDTVPTVTFAGAAATAVERISPTSVRCVTPAMAGADPLVDVVVSLGGQSGTLTDAFTYTLRAGENPVGTQPGLFARYHRVGGPLLPTFAALTPDIAQLMPNANAPGSNPFEGRNDYWSTRHAGYLTVTQGGVYTLYTASDDGSRLYIGDTLVVENNFAQGVTERSGQVALAAGTHRLAIEFAQGNGGFGMYVRWQGPGIGYDLIPDSAFSTDPTPVPSGLSLANGPQNGGTTVTITGTGFINGAGVTFGGVAASSVVTTATTITCVTPSHAPGVVDVVVVNPTGLSGTFAGAFTFDAVGAPDLVGLMPATGSVVGGTLVTLSGNGFAAPMSVTFGGVAATAVTVVDDTTITARTPARTGGTLTVDVVVTNGAGQTDTLVGGFAYTLRTPDNPSSTQAGLAYRYYRVTGNALPDFSTLTPDASGVRANATINGGNPIEPGRNDTWSMEFRGYVEVPADGIYTFYTGSDDGSQLYIGDLLVVENNFWQGVTYRSGQIGLAAGRHAVRITFAQGGGGFGLFVQYESGALARTDIPDAAFTTDAAPTITGVAPGNGPIAGGTTVTITGTGFTSGTGVTFGGTPATGVAVLPDGTALTAVTPAHALGTVAVVVTSGGGLTAPTSGSFLYQAPFPTITAVSPQVGPVAGGTQIQITGSNFQAGVGVTVGGVAASDVLLAGGIIYARTPAGSQGPVDVVVTNADGRSATRSNGFFFQGVAPTVTVIAPVSGARDSTHAGATITGTGFYAGARVFLGGVEVTPVSVDSATQLGFTIPLLPTLQGPVAVTVQNTDLQSATLANGYRVIGPAPTITTLTPTLGPQGGGTAVRIDGSGFYAGVQVSFDGVAIASNNITVTSAVRLDVVTPVMPTQGPVDVVVTNTDLGSATLSDGFISQGPSPTVTVLSPAIGPMAGGQTVVITGTGFLAGARVFIGGIEVPAGDITVNGATSITVITPLLTIQGPQAVTVTNIDLRSGTRTAGYIAQGDPPQVTGVSPTNGPLAGGTTVVIAGDDFLPGARVFLGTAEVPAGDVSVDHAQQITIVTPAGIQGPNDVTVTNVDQLSDTLTDAFIYLGDPPVVSGLDVTAAPLNVATTVVISGSDFVAGATVTIGGLPATVIGLTGSAITITTPTGGTPGVVDVVITNIDGQSAIFGGFIIQGPAPILTGIDVPFGPVTGSRRITLTGSAFRAGLVVTFGGVPGTVESVSATTIVVVAPAHGSGAVAVTVTNDDLLSSTLPAAYTYYTHDDEHTTGNGCGTGGGLTALLLIGWLSLVGGGWRRR